VLRNGSFIKSDIFPRLGYFADTEKRMPGDSTARFNHYQSIDADLIDFEAIVSTTPEQTALAPGYLVKEWTENNRRYFQYKMDRPIKFVLGFNSGVYALYAEKYKGLDLQIYHHPQHTYCLPQMLDGLKAAVEYNTRYFSPYQHRQAKIIEFSKAEGSYATTAGNCIPTSEMRFINDSRNAADGFVDISFYVAAHELSHQWWGNQLIPADALGALALTESITEYITAKIYERKYGKKNAARFLEIQLNRYLQGRTTESQTEPPLIHVHPDQSYIAYGKGAVAFYTLSAHIGEENLNKALRDYLEYAKTQQPPYTTSLELLHFLKKGSPDSLHYLITDMFETADADKTIRHFNELKLLQTDKQE
jgi:ABC-2 type transport system permease protein